MKPTRALRLNAVTRLLWRVHRWLFLTTRGWVGSSFLGRRVLLLRTKGRRSGVRREVALYSFGGQNREIVVASYVGEPRHPAWYLNLKAEPRAQILGRGRWLPVMAREVMGDERFRLWTTITTKDPSYRVYQERTSREIPVVILEPEYADAAHGPMAQTARR